MDNWYDKYMTFYGKPYRVVIIRGEDGSMAFNLKKYGKIVFVRDKRCKAITGYGTVGNESLLKSFVRRVKFQLQGITRFFYSTEYYVDRKENLVKIEDK